MNKYFIAQMHAAWAFAMIVVSTNIQGVASPIWARGFSLLSFLGMVGVFSSNRMLFRETGKDTDEEAEEKKIKKWILTEAACSIIILAYCFVRSI